MSSCCIAVCGPVARSRTVVSGRRARALYAGGCGWESRLALILPVLAVSCSPLAEAVPMNPRQQGAVEAVLSSWGQENLRCYGSARNLRILTGSQGEVGSICGQPAFACLAEDVVVLQQVYVGTDSELTLLMHETVHHMARCVDGRADQSHSRPDLWIKTDVCLSESVEGRARLLTGLDGCDVAPRGNCCL